MRASSGPRIPKLMCSETTLHHGCPRPLPEFAPGLKPPARSCSHTPGTQEAPGTRGGAMFESTVTRTFLAAGVAAILLAPAAQAADRGKAIQLQELDPA